MTDLSSFDTCSGVLHDSDDSTRANMPRDLQLTRHALRGPQASTAVNVEESQRLMLSLARSPIKVTLMGLIWRALSLWAGTSKSACEPLTTSKKVEAANELPSKRRASLISEGV